MTNAELIIEAYKVGKAARAEQRERTPSLDPALTPLLKSVSDSRRAMPPVQGTIDVLDAWLQGWDEVHFAEVFPVPTRGAIPPHASEPQ